MAEIAPKPVKLPPFQAWLASNIPAVYDNTMSYYDELTSLIKWLETEVVPNVNSAIVLVNQLRNFVENYFDNLDVQEEINNKLDQMAEDGTLQEIITTYIQSNVTWTFDTVADMKAATNLIDGSYARTLGYHTINDGGESLYYITDTGTANEEDVIAVGSLYANLITGTELKPEQFGAYGDGTHDDTAIIQDCLAYVAGKPIKLALAHTYLVSAISSASDSSNRKVCFELASNTTIEGCGKVSGFIIDDAEVNPYWALFYTASGLTQENISLRNFKIYQKDSNVADIDPATYNPRYIVYLYSTITNLTIDDVLFDHVYSRDVIMINTQDSSSSNVKITNCVFNFHSILNRVSTYDCTVAFLKCNTYIFNDNVMDGDNFACASGLEMHGYNGTAKNNKITNFQNAMHIEPSGLEVANLEVENNYLHGYDGIVMWDNTTTASQHGLENIRILNNFINVDARNGANTTIGGIRLAGSTFTRPVKDIKITGNTIDFVNIYDGLNISALYCGGLVFNNTTASIDGLSITNNIITNSIAAGINIGSSSTSTTSNSNIVIDGNIIKDAAQIQVSSLAASAAIRFSKNTNVNVIVRNNILLDNITDSNMEYAFYNSGTPTACYWNGNIVSTVNGSDHMKLSGNSGWYFELDKQIPIVSPNGTKFYIKVANDGTLSAS